MRTMTKRNPIYELDEVLTTGILCECLDFKPFRAREALELVKHLGRPLTDEEMKQFEID